MRAVRALLLAALAFASGACGTDVVGPGTPECDDPGEEISTATIMQLQAVPDAKWGPCINELRVGWKYQDQFAESGRAVFWLDSDRVGERFVEIELTPTCDPGRAETVGNPEPDVERRVRVFEEPGDLPVAVVPVAARHVGDARALATSVTGRKIRERTLVPFVVESDGPAADRILEAQRTVGFVIVVDDAEITSGTVELRRPRHEAEQGITMEDALDEIEDDLDRPAYRAEWFHTFEGGCIVYRFDAEGSGSSLIDVEISDAIGFYPLGELRQAARDAGFDV
jgi:hypothetical protein